MKHFNSSLMAAFTLLILHNYSLPADAANGDETFPLVSHRITAGQRQGIDLPRMMPPSTVSLQPALRPSAAHRANQKVGSAVLWADMADMAQWPEDISRPGIYTFRPDDGDAELLLDIPDMALQYGTGVVGSQFYGVDANLALVSWGLVYVYLYQIDTESWEWVRKGERIQSNNMVALETASHLATGTVYGVFYAANFRSLELGIADYENGSRTTIGNVSHEYVALGVTSAEKLYGVATDGNLYIIDGETATETLVGPTGLTIVNAQGNYYAQSGEIDQHDDTFYWLARCADGSGGLYTIDLETGKAEIVYEWDVSAVGLQVSPRVAVDDAPDKVFNLQARFEEGSTTGQVSFHMPSITYGGDPLTGTVGYTVLAGSEELARGTAEAGSEVSVSVTAPSGMQTLFVVTNNDSGDGPKAFVKLWIGFDVPQIATDVVLSANNDTRVAELSWTAPTDGVHNAWMGDLTYDVYRLSNLDTLLVSSHQTATTFTEVIPQSQLTRYAYVVVAHNGDRVSSNAVSNSIFFDDVLQVPYLEDFLLPEFFTQYTVYNANGDTNPTGLLPPTWNYQGANHRVFYYCQVNGQSAADDWLITPPIELKAGREYVFSLKATNYWPAYEERLEVTMGSGKDIADQTTTVIPVTDIDSYHVYTPLKNDTVRVEADGIYYFGLHALSDAGKYNLYVDSIQVVEGAIDGAPGYVTQMEVTPEPHGLRQATVAFCAPVITSDGQPLEGSLTTDILRDDVLIGSVDVAPGQRTELTDEVPDDGFHTYTVATRNGIGNGRQTSQTLFVGTDIPKHVENIAFQDNAKSVTMTWDASEPTGVNGGIVPADGVEYDIWSMQVQTSIAGTAVVPLEVIATVTGTSYTIDLNTDSGLQEMRYWAVQPRNAAGAGEGYYAGLFVGLPFDLPVEESFMGQAVSYYWTYDASSPNLTLQWAEGADGADDYALALNAASDNQVGILYSGKLNMKEAVKPMLYFDLLTTVGGSSVEVVALTPDGSQDVLCSIKPTLDFERQEVSLEAYAGQRFVRFAIVARLSKAGRIVLDNFRVESAVADGISQIENRKSKIENSFDLSGRRLSDGNHRLPAGIYIRDNKKVIIK